MNSSLIKLLILVLLTAGPALAESGEITTVLVPYRANGSGISEGSNRLELKADDEFNPTAEACLEFDLSPIPKNATVRTVRLRLVAKQKEKRQSVDVFPAKSSSTCSRADGNERALGGWDGDPDEESTAFEATLSASAVLGEATLRLFLSSATRSTDWKYGGPGVGVEPSDKPLLMVSYTLPAKDRPVGPRIPTPALGIRRFPPPAEAAGNTGGETFNTVVSGPLLYNDSVIAIAKPGSETTRLYSFSTTGEPRWSKGWKTAVEGVAGTHSVVHGDYLFNFGTENVSISNLANRGDHVATVSYRNLSPTNPRWKTLNLLAPPAIAAGGNIYFVGQPKPGEVFLYGLSPYSKITGASLQPILRRSVLRSASSPRVSRLAVSPPGEEFRVYAIVDGVPWDVDAATGERRTAQGFVSGSATDRFFDPVVTSGPKGDYLVVGDTRSLAVFSNGRLRWSWPAKEETLTAPLSGPTVARDSDSGKDFVLVVGNGSFRRLALDGSFDKNCRSTEVDLEADSNIAVDASGAAYLWSKGTLYGFDRKCFPVFRRTLRLAGAPHLVSSPDGGLILAPSLRPGEPSPPSASIYALKPMQVEAGGNHTCALLNGVVKCWGANGSGQLGRGDRVLRGNEPNQMGRFLPPVDLGSAGRVAQLAAGDGFTCALFDLGAVKCWGGNASGVLGQGDAEDRGDDPGEMGDALDFIDLGRGVTVTQIAAGDDHACALLDDGSVKCWGNNRSGRLGQGDAAPRGYLPLHRGDDPGEMGDALEPIDLGRNQRAHRIAAGSNHTCALLEGGAVKCWGSNGSGKLGLGNRSPDAIGDQPGEMGDALEAVNLGTGRKATDIAAGRSQSCALLDDGLAKCWGSNYAGLLGGRDFEDRGYRPSDMGDALEPLDLGTGRKVAQIAIRSNHACALLDDESVKCWGENDSGQLGLGNYESRPDGNRLDQASPAEQMGDSLGAVDLGTGRKTLEVTVGDYHSCALLDNGSIKCWGANTQGELGLGDTDDRGDDPGELGDSLPVVLAWQEPGACDLGERFEDRADGTMMHCKSRLLWLKNPGCLGKLSHSQARSAAGRLASGDDACGLTDASGAGDWRLPTVAEFRASAPWSEDEAFVGVGKGAADYYWTASREEVWSRDRSREPAAVADIANCRKACGKAPDPNAEWCSGAYGECREGERDAYDDAVSSHESCLSGCSRKYAAKRIGSYYLGIGSSQERKCLDRASGQPHAPSRCPGGEAFVWPVRKERSKP